jgi:hypothetical protein
MGKSKKDFFEDLCRQSDKQQSITQPYEDVIDARDLQIKELQHQILGYKAVISYLEHQLGLGNSQ